MSSWPWTERKVAQRCPHPGCRKPPGERNCRCDRHAEEHREGNKLSARRARRFERAQLTLVGVG